MGEFFKTNKMKPDKEAEVDSSEKTRWRVVLYDFTQDTTIHALKQITEPTPFTIRRILWILLLALGLVAFVLQVVESIIYYMSNPVAVNIMINYNDTLRFPAVTICNQNAFRMTKASEIGEYDAIESLFSHEEHSLDHQDHGPQPNSTVLHTSISQMYMDLAHRPEDFIIDCEWEQRPCSAKDFERTLTDHGICYTFNNAEHLSQVKNATETGALWGLRLKLNVEQYEYMMGPNGGAGVRVLIHSPQDFPLVSDFGQSVPPGLHAFLGIMIVEISDLPEPHGKCQDDIELEHFKHYTRAACLRECEQRMIREICGCSHGTLPQNSPPGFPACTVLDHIDCVKSTLKGFRDFRDKCYCPYPCERTHFDSDITYGDMSNFDMEKMMHGNMTQLQNKFGAARETSQVVIKEIVKKDKRNALLLAKVIQDVGVILNNITTGLDKMMLKFEADAEIMMHKIWFHHDVGLEKVKYIVEHDFIRGWEVVEERTFDHVATGFWEIVSSFDRVLELLRTKYIASDIVQKELLWYNVDDRLYNRLTMAERALENITEVYEAYSTGDPLLRYRTTLDRRYDMTFIPIHLITLNPTAREKHFNESQKQMLKYIAAIQEMRQCGEQVVSGDTVCVGIVPHRDSFIKSAKMVNYNLFQFKTKVLEKPVEAIDKIITEFLGKNESLWQEYIHLKGLLLTVQKDVATFALSSWLNIRQASDQFSNYTLLRSTTKSSLADNLNSEKMNDDILAFHHFFLNLRSRAIEIKDSCMRLREQYVAIFKTMAEEESTKKFYAMVYEDVKAYFTSPLNASEYVRHFADLTDLPESRITGSTKEGLLKLLNADFHGMDIPKALQNISDFFERDILPGAEIDNMLDNIDEFLGNLLKEIREDLARFTLSTNIGYEFFRENYLNLDVYMRALSYEAITQQIAYDMTNLWSDIGGSIGLFIGASAISVFEVLDVFVHTSMKIAREKHLKRKRSRANGNDYSKENKTKEDENKERGWMFTHRL